MSRTRNAEDAKDLKQEILVDVWANFNKFDPNLGSFIRWAFCRTRTITTEWIRSEMHRLRPVLKKGWRAPSVVAETLRIGDEERVREYDLVFYESTFGIYVSELRTMIEASDHHGDCKTSMLNTFDLLVEGRSKNEIRETLNINPRTLSRNFERIRDLAEKYDDIPLKRKNCLQAV